MSYLEVNELTKSFADTRVLDGVSVLVEEAETLVLLGPSGSGKTTLLRLIAGFETVDSGSIRLAGEAVADLPPEARRFGMVFQHYALFPHLTVGENVAFGLKSGGRKASDVDAAVAQALAQVELERLANRRVDAISGGQQQRVALARALAPRPRLLLLDEPLSNLDPDLRERTRQDLAVTLARVGITAVWVTHEQEEAFDVGSRVAVLNGGRLEQVGTPADLYRRPATPFVARFVGRASVLPGRLTGEATAVLQLTDGATKTLQVSVQGGGETGRDVDIYVRPEAWQVVDQPGGEAIDVRVAGRRFAGRENLVRASVRDSPFEIEFASEKDFEIGDELHLVLRRDAQPTAFPKAEDTP